MFKSPRATEKQIVIDSTKEKENERKAKGQKSRRVAVDLERSKSREVVVDSRHVKSRTQLAQRSQQSQRATAATPVQRTAPSPKPLTATEQLQQFSTKLDFVIKESNISSEFLESLLDQLLKHLSEESWALEQQELITNVHCQLFSIMSNPVSEARNVLRLLQKLIIKTYDLLLSQCNEEAKESLRSETLLRLTKPSLGTQTTSVFDKVKEVAMRTALSTVASATEPTGKKNK